MRTLNELAANLWSGLRLALFLPVQRSAFRFTLGQAGLLVLMGFAAFFGYQYLITDETRSFNVYGLSYEAAIALVTIVTLLLIARLRRHLTSTIALCVALSATFPIAILLTFLVELIEADPDTAEAAAVSFVVFVLVVAWSFIIPVRVIRLVFNAGRGAALALALVYWLPMLAVSVALPYEPLWYDDSFDWDSNTIWAQTDETPDEEQDGDYWAAYRELDAERIYYAQPALMRDALARLAPQRPGVSDLYLVGFGSYAYQDVFWNEVRTVRELFDERFDTSDRSLAMVNNLETLDELPLANKPNLQSALNVLANRIDREEDLVALFLTSHGSKGHDLSISFWPLGLNDLSAGELKIMLDESGIKWRIVIVSACYSGGFLDALKDDNTLVMTAASRDRRSFGCSNEAEFTYFGRAYFDQELRRGHSFTDAFYAAAEAIAARETQEGLEASEPQIHIGEAIAPRLRAFEQRIAPEPGAALN